VLVAKVGRCPKERLAAEGIEPVEQYAFEPIEAAALAWLVRYAARLAAREPRLLARPEPVATVAAPATALEVA
jgi:hypothetical protein